MTHALTYAPSDPSIVYLCTDTSQVWRSSDGGETWKHAGSGMGVNGCRSLAVDPVNPERVVAAGFLGVEEKAGRNHPQKLQALYLTENGGETWKVVKETNFFRQVSKSSLIAHDSSTSNNDKTFVWYAGTYDDGLFISKDGGFVWEPLAPDLKKTCDLKAIPSKPGQLLIATESDLFHYDKSQTRKIGKGLPAGACAIAIHPADANTVIAAAGVKGIYRSTNGGISFEVSNRGLSMNPPNMVSLAISNKPPFVLYAKAHGAQRRLPFYSKDAGVTWAQGRYGEFTRTHGSQQHFWFSSILAPHPTDPMQCLVVSSGDGKVFKTNDGGATWDLFGRGYTGARVMDMSFDEAGIIIVALTDFGLWTGRRDEVYFRGLQIPRFRESSSTHLVRGAGDIIVATVGTWHDQCIAVRQPNGRWKLHPEVHGDMRFLAVHPRDSNLIYVDAFRSLDKGMTWERLTKQVSAISGLLVDRVYALESKDDQSSFVLVSEDRGVSWSTHTPPVHVARSRITSLVPDTHDAKRLYLATNDGVWIFDGKNWSRKADKEGLMRDRFGLCYVSALVADPSRPGRLFAGKAAPGRGLSNGIFVSNNGGETWTDITGNLGSELYVWSLRLDTVGATLYAGTDRGLQRLRLDSEKK